MENLIKDSEGLTHLMDFLLGYLPVDKTKNYTKEEISQVVACMKLFEKLGGEFIKIDGKIYISKNTYKMIYGENYNKNDVSVSLLGFAYDPLELDIMMDNGLLYEDKSPGIVVVSGGMEASIAKAAICASVHAATPIGTQGSKKDFTIHPKVDPTNVYNIQTHGKIASSRSSNLKKDAKLSLAVAMCAGVNPNLKKHKSNIFSNDNPYSIKSKKPTKFVKRGR